MFQLRFKSKCLLLYTWCLKVVLSAMMSGLNWCASLQWFYCICTEECLKRGNPSFQFWLIVCDDVIHSGGSKFLPRPPYTFTIERSLFVYSPIPTMPWIFPHGNVPKLSCFIDISVIADIKLSWLVESPVSHEFLMSAEVNIPQMTVYANSCLTDCTTGSAQMFACSLSWQEAWWCRTVISEHTYQWRGCWGSTDAAEMSSHWRLLKSIQICRNTACIKIIYD